MKTIFKIAVLSAVALSALILQPSTSQAQTYYTNAYTTNNLFGAAQYNQAFPTPLKPSAVLANQYAAGTLAGSFSGTLVPNQGYYTNTFSTNIYSAAPYVVASGSVTNAGAAIVSTSPTNFVIQLLVTNCTVYWEATGH